MPGIIEARGVGVRYGDASDSRSVQAVEDVNLTVESGRFVTMVGASGCGKSTLLYAIAGLVPVTTGDLLVRGQPVSGPGPDRGMVFQHSAIFPWRNVADNIALGLQVRGDSKSDRAAAVDALIETVGLRGFEKHYPHQLSGGMQQRVGIARALAIEPEILLLDEPFGALDALTRDEMGEELLRISDSIDNTVIFVTHDVDEAVYLADEVVVMSSRPGCIRERVTIDLPRPRGLEIRNSPMFSELRQEVWRHLQG